MENIGSKKKVAVYCRSARDEQLGSVIEWCQNFIEEHPEYDVIDWFKETGSGRNINPELVNMLKRVEENAYDAIIVKDISDLSRDTRKIRGICNKLSEYSTELIIGI